MKDFFRNYNDECGYRKSCFEVSTKYKGSFGFMVSLGGYYTDNIIYKIHLWWVNIFITSHFKVNRDTNFEDRKEYGFTFTNYEGCEHLLFLCWGSHRKIVDMPWKYDHYRTTYYYKDGKPFFNDYSYPWIIRKIYPNQSLCSWWMRRDYIDSHPDEFKMVFDYKYTLKSGEVQERKATCVIEEREWRPKWLWWTSCFNDVRRTLDIEFDAEVGERTGSWKGGVLGTGCEIKPGETPEEAFRRFEREEKM